MGRSEVSGILNLRANKLDKNDYFRCMKQKAVISGVTISHFKVFAIKA